MESITTNMSKTPTIMTTHIMVKEYILVFLSIGSLSHMLFIIFMDFV